MSTNQSQSESQIESLEYYMPSMPSERLVEYLGAKIRSLNKFDSVTSYRR